MFPALHRRADLVELMDAPDCGEALLFCTLRQFTSINRLVARYRAILRRWVLADMQHDPAREYHLLDMGAGGCDIAAWLLAAARRRGLRLRITAGDMDERTVRYARSVHGQTAGLHIVQRDLLADDLGEPVDYVFGNHFLHHLSEDQIVTLLGAWQPRVRRRMIFSDLRRSRSAYVGFAIFGAFYRNSFAYADGLTSIRRGFRGSELAALAARAGLAPYAAVHRLIPSRLVLVVAGSGANAGR